MPPLRILISRPDRIGDVVLSTALPREIKRKYPESHISLLLRDYTKDIYLNNPYVDEILIREDNLSIIDELKYIKKLRGNKFTHGFMLLPHQRINWILMLAGIKKRFGSGHKLFQLLTNTKSVSRHKYIPLRSESDYVLDFIRKIGIEPEDLSSEIHLSDNEQDIVAGIKKELTYQKKYVIGINTSSGNSAPNWKISEYINLINLLSEKDEFRVIITDYAPHQDLKKLTGINFVNEDKKLRDSIINFASLDALISSSTGPMHICAALKVPTISLFCPLTACSPKLWGPMGNRNVIILPEENYCQQRCPGDPKKCKFEGEGGISPEKVFSKVLKFFELDE